MPYTITTQIEIAAPPAHVRKVFLDFPTYPDWSKAFLKSIEPVSPAADGPAPGSKLRVQLPGMAMTPTVLVNTPEEFKWRGVLMLDALFSGEHAFHFTPSADAANAGGTTFIHKEDFAGWLDFLIKPESARGADTKKGFEAFNEELKARAEGAAAPATATAAAAATATAPAAPATPAAPAPTE